MAKVEMPREVDCPICGEPLRVVTTGNTVLPGEILIDFGIMPCTSWCELLRRA